MLTVDQTIRSYSGRPGCMCGCNGTYNDGERARKMAITALLKNPEVELQTWNHRLTGEVGCLFVRTSTRNRVLYLTAAGVDAARALGIKEN